MALGAFEHENMDAALPSWGRQPLCWKKEKRESTSEKWNKEKEKVKVQVKKENRKACTLESDRKNVIEGKSVLLTEKLALSW